MEPVRIAVTGGAGQIAYSLLFRIASGELFPGVPVSLRVCDVEGMAQQLEGVRMELLDCAFPLLQEVVVGSDINKLFEGVQYVFLVGAKPRGPGMERKDLLADNGRIFVGQGRALSDVADRDMRALVVGNPCNTNCLIAIHNAPKLRPEQFQAMTRLDQNRACALLAQKADCPVSSVAHMAIWGNHSTTQAPDFLHATIEGQPAVTRCNRVWLEGEFVQQVRQRGAVVIAARGKSSAGSAATAALDAMRSWAHGDKQWYSAGVYGSGASYGLDGDLVFSVPCTGNMKPVAGVGWDAWLEAAIRASEKELIEERAFIKDLL